ncbi:MAG TPA: hypothetical protein VKR61_10040 [Bryobacteraceae bacterium]|nr:hypothetical protein [Bryobacteraceae bacterium]
MKRYILTAMAGSALTVAGAFAQSTTPAPPGTTAGEAQRHEARVENQRDRIQQGVKDGQLTKGQAHALNRQDKRINAEAQRMKTRDGGQLTDRQEARIHQQMNRNSQRIYRARH